VNALTALVLVLLGLRLAAMVLQVLVSRSPEARKPRPAFDPCLEPYVLSRSAPASPEGELVSGLTTGAIDRLRYQQEMAALAAADARPHPLVVPSDERGG
jgi:hypothetical protein